MINRSNRELRREPKRITGSGAEKSSRLFPQSPVPQTDTGGWVEYTKARERDLSKELGINSLVTSGEEVPRPFWAGNYSMFYVYVLRSPTGDFLYIGFTADLRRRFKEHQGQPKHRGWRLAYYEAYADERDARERERKLKSCGSALGKLKARAKHSLAIPGIERAGSQ